MHAILRTYNNPKTIDLIHRLGNSAVFQGIVVVINGRQDKINTQELIMERAFKTPIQIISLQDYGWSRAINAGLHALPPITENKELVLLVSNEVEIEPREIEQLKEAALSEHASCGYALFKNRTEPSYRLPRNTCAVWRRSLFDEIGYFDEELDSRGGMEDYEMVLRAYSQKELLPRIGAKDVKLDIDDKRMPGKLKMEMKAIAFIERQFLEKAVMKVNGQILKENVTN